MEDDITLKDVTDILIRQWKVIFYFTLFCVLVSVIVSFILPPKYEGNTQILIRTSQPQQIPAISSLIGLNIGQSQSSISEIDELLQTPQVEKKVREMMLGHPSIEAKNIDDIDLGKLKTKTKGSILTISVLHKNPVLAADIANAYAKAVDYYWNKLNISEARKKLQYLENQLPIAERDLNAAQNRLKNLTYLISTSQNLISGQNAKTIDVMRLEKEYEIQSSIYQMIKTEYANTKIQVAKEVSPFSDVYPAKVSFTPAYPKKKLNLVVGFLFGAFGGVFIALLVDYYQSAYKKN